MVWHENSIMIMKNFHLYHIFIMKKPIVYKPIVCQYHIQYKEEAITNKIIYDSLELLDEKIREYYLSKGIELYDYD